MGNLMFAIFTNLEEFNLWHESIKRKLEYPFHGRNAATGELDTETLITDYTAARTVESDDRVIAWVGDETQNLTLVNPVDYPDYFESKLPWL